MKKFAYFTPFERALWCSSMLLITITFFWFSQDSLLTLVASWIGVTALIFNAKGNPFGQLLMVIFSILYGIISYSFAYYGEMITYLGMSMPMAILALVSWLKNPYNGNRSEVKIATLTHRDVWQMLWLTAAVSVVFYFVLRGFGTANLLPSTLSVTTSFLAVYLTSRRSAYYALAYAANDAVLIILWVLAAFQNPTYVSVIVCFVVFLVNDLYSFFNWRRMQRRQAADSPCE